MDVNAFWSPYWLYFFHECRKKFLGHQSCHWKRSFHYWDQYVNTSIWAISGKIFNKIYIHICYFAIHMFELIRTRWWSNRIGLMVDNVDLEEIFEDCCNKYENIFSEKSRSYDLYELKIGRHQFLSPFIPWSNMGEICIKYVFWMRNI